MAIFNELAVDLMILNEKKTHEEYSIESFKKKYNFVPDKEGSNKGTITDSSGKKYHIDIRPNENIDAKSIIGPYTSKSAENSSIVVGKKFFNLKGSNGNERRDAIIQHEIGHQNLHNQNPKNKSVNKENRSDYVFKDLVSKNVKKETGLDPRSDKEIQNFIDDKFSKIPKDHRPTISMVRQAIYDARGASEYSKTVGTKEEQSRRDGDYNKAKKYETKLHHGGAEEIEADRFAANRTSEKALKRGLHQIYKKDRAEFEKKYDSIDDPNKEKDKNKARRLNSEELKDDYENRSKALKDEDLRKAKTYK